jgi:hypothetical protein
MRMMSDEIAKRLHSNDGAGDGVVLRDCLLDENLQSVPGTAAQVGQEFSIIEEIFSQNLRDAKDDMPMGNLFEGIHA